MSSYCDTGKEVLEKEAHAILAVMEGLGADFDRAVETINKCKGRVVFTGIGKSGNIGQKILVEIISYTECRNSYSVSPVFISHFI